MRSMEGLCAPWVSSCGTGAGPRAAAVILGVCWFLHVVEGIRCCNWLFRKPCLAKALRGSLRVPSPFTVTSEGT